MSRCPGWCVQGDSPTHLHQSPHKTADGVVVALLQGNDRVPEVQLVYIGGGPLAAPNTCLSVPQAQAMAGILSGLHHPELAALLAACVDATTWEDSMAVTG